MNQCVFLGRTFFVSNFIISSWIFIKISINSQQIRFELLTKRLCVTQHGFGNMAHFMAKTSHFYNLPTGFLNINPKPDVINFIFYIGLPDIMYKKNNKFYIYILRNNKFIIPKKSHRKHAHTGLIS